MSESDKSSQGIVEIEDVPSSPNTSYDQTVIYNPMDEDFVCNWDGKPYTIGADATASFPEFLAYHIAKHLTEKILYSKVEKKIAEKVKELNRTGSVAPAEPTGGKSLPKKDVAEMMAVILSGEKGKEAFSALQNEGVVDISTVAEPAIEVASDATEEPAEVVEPEESTTGPTETEGVSEGTNSKEVETKTESVKPEDMSWNELQRAVKAKGLYKLGQKKQDLIDILNK